MISVKKISVVAALGSWAILVAQAQTLSVRPQGGEVRFDWSQVASNTVYALEATDDLRTPDWQRLPAFERSAVPDLSHVFAPGATDSFRFFRLEAIDRGELLSSGPLTELSALCGAVRALATFRAMFLTPLLSPSAWPSYSRVKGRMEMIVA